MVRELTPSDRDWPEYVAVIDGAGQSKWAFAPHFEPYSRHYVMAKQDGRVVGFLMYVVWEIGPHDRDHPPVVLNGQKLTEAKILAFGVQEAYRRRGIGRALQEHTLRRARAPRLPPGAVGQRRRPCAKPAPQAGHGIRRGADGTRPADPRLHHAAHATVVTARRRSQTPDAGVSARSPTIYQSAANRTQAGLDLADVRTMTHVLQAAYRYRRKPPSVRFRGQYARVGVPHQELLLADPELFERDRRTLARCQITSLTLRTGE